MTFIPYESIQGRSPETGSSLSSAVELPHNFRIDDFLAFHNRDPSALAERVEDRTLQKGLAWDGNPACLTIRFLSRRANADLFVDGSLADDAADRLARMIRRMLGLTQRVDEFENVYRCHPQLGPLIAERPSLRVSLCATPFEALIWAITGQSISVSAAIALRRRLIRAVGLRHSRGLACFPDAAQMTSVSEDTMRRAGFSKTKAQALNTVSHHVRSQRFPMDTWLHTLAIDDIQTQLLRVRGIGSWTANYALLRGFGWLDGSLHGDVAVRRSLQSLLGSSVTVTEKYAQHWLAEFSPWRALVAAHLWAV